MTSTQQSLESNHASRSTHADRWRDFGSGFAQLANEETETVRKTGKHLELHACGVYVETPEILRQKGRTEIPPTGRWRLVGGINESFRERFRALATRAGVAAGCPKETEPEVFWLHLLYSDLRRNKSDQLYESSDVGGTISRVCVASETFCSRLEKQAAAEVIKAMATTQPAELASLHTQTVGSESTNGKERGKFCDQVISEIKRIKNLVVGTGRSVAEIEEENPNFAVWKVRTSLSPEDQETFNHPNQWGPPVGYAKIVLSKTHDVSTHTINSWVKAYRKAGKTEKS